ETKQLAKLKRYGQIKVLLEGAVDDYGKKSLRDYDRIFQAMLEIVREGNDFPASRELFVRLMWVFEKHHYKGRRDTHQLNLSTLNLDLRRMNREKAVFEKLAVELERLGADSSRLHAANRVKELEAGIAEVKTIIGKIKRKMTPNETKSVPNATDDDA
ncbi:MAG: hypothetical protein LBV28_01720, partial [Puniceicoccales bacterium]|nr:hypothetical protein [Puniceicoccales bacterium]